MNDAKRIGRSFLQKYYPNLICYTIIVVLVVLLPVKNPVTLTLAVTTPLLASRLLTARTVPNFSSWLRTIVTTGLWVTGLYYLNKWLGLLGILGFALLILILSGIIIVRQWKLLVYTMRWGAARLHGSKKNFDIKKVIGNNGH